MRKLIMLTFAMVMSLTSMAQSMKMVVDASGDAVGRLERVNANTYTVCVQDTYDIPKTGHRVVTFSAAKGQGVVYRDQERVGNINVRKGPSTNTAVVAKIPDYKGEYVPDCYPCLGKVKGWYKVNVDGKIGYVRGDLLCWDGMCTF